jgi:hypothetical protein
MKIREFIDSNYDWLIEVSTKITASDPNKDEIKYDLLSFVCLHLIEVGKYDELHLDDFKYVFAKYLKDNYRWSNSEFNRSLRLISETDLSKVPKQPNKEDYFIDIMADCERNCDEEKELISNYADLSVSKIKFARSIEPKLPPHLRNLFDMYINQGMSREEIRVEIGMSVSSTRNLIVELTNIILKEWNQSQLSSQDSPVSGTSLPKPIFQNQLSL